MTVSVFIFVVIVKVVSRRQCSLSSCLSSFPCFSSNPFSGHDLSLPIQVAVYLFFPGAGRVLCDVLQSFYNLLSLLNREQIRFVNVTLCRQMINMFLLRVFAPFEPRAPYLPKTHDAELLSRRTSFLLFLFGTEFVFR